MMKRIASWLMALSGWSVNMDYPPQVSRCVMTAAPHTSNWDLWYARLAFFVMGVPVRFTIKKGWMRFPLNLVIGPLGGIPIDRRPRQGLPERASYVDQLAAYFRQYPEIAILVTPEGTRKARKQWKTGFYYAALQAGVPVCLGYLDYRKKEAGVGPVIYPSGDIASDMRRVIDFYSKIPGKFPEKFSVDERYA
ncbi:MAG: 1-acyl-sn-glycerol-3-phosphate acyltransferase [Saprospiraceae bacterium]